MLIQVKYFGQIEEFTGVREEKIDLGEAKTVGDFHHYFSERFPELKTITFVLAIDHELKDENYTVRENCEIAVLPPFAGG